MALAWIAATFVVAIALLLVVVRRSRRATLTQQERAERVRRAVERARRRPDR